MHEYDITLKTVIKGLTAPAFRLLTGADQVVDWHNSELPEVRSPRVDMLGSTADGGLVHVELQSHNDPDMPWRMLVYGAEIRKAHGHFPTQVVLYTGREAMKMSRQIDESALTFRYSLIDIREIDGEALLASPHLEDNIISVLTRLVDQRGAVKRILGRIAASEPELRGQAMKELEILAGLRNLASVVKGEITGMPILDDIMDHEVLGPKYREGRADGVAEGIEKGIEKGERQVVRRLIEKRFGPVPAWADRRLEGMRAIEIENLALRLLTAASLTELLD